MSAFAAQGRETVAWYLDRARWRVIALELLVTAAFMIVYFFLRGIRPPEVEDSVSRSLAVIHLEQRAGFFWEVAWQQAFLDHDLLIGAANLVYAWAHYPVMLAVGIWLLIKDPYRFRFVRSVLLVSGVIGIVTYWLFPAAPPRLMGLYGYDFGFADTVHAAKSNAHYFQPGPFVNDFAALPSFHFGWIALSAAAIWINTRQRSARIAAVLLCVVMFWAITVTANHYFFDMAMGAAVVAFSWWVVSLSARLPVGPWLRSSIIGRP